MINPNSLVAKTNEAAATAVHARNTTQEKTCLLGRRRCRCTSALVSARQITDVQFSPDGYILASAAADGQVKLWDLRAGKPMHTFQVMNGSVSIFRQQQQQWRI